MSRKDPILFTSHFKSTPALVLLFLVVIELGVRIFTFGLQAIVSWQKYDPMPLQMTALVAAFPDEKLGWKLRPSLDTFYKGQVFTTNSHGFRDRERSVIPTPERSRLAVLGRSYEMGTGVGDAETWPAQLEDQFFQGRTDVLNFGVEGYSMLQVEAAFHRFAKNFKAQCVLLPLFYEEIDTVIQLQANPLPTTLEKLSVSAWAEHFYLPRWVQQSFWWALFRHGSGDWSYLPLPSWRKPREMVAADSFATVVQRLVAAIQKENASVFLLPLPRLIRSSDKLYEKGRRLLDVYAHSQTNVVLVKELEQLHGDIGLAALATPGDPHFGGEFLERIADIVHTAVVRSKLCK